MSELIKYTEPKTVTDLARLIVSGQGKELSKAQIRLHEDNGKAAFFKAMTEIAKFYNWAISPEQYNGLFELVSEMWHFTETDLNIWKSNWIKGLYPIKYKLEVTDIQDSLRGWLSEKSAAIEKARAAESQSYKGQVVVSGKTAEQFAEILNTLKPESKPKQVDNPEIKKMVAGYFADFAKIYEQQGGDEFAAIRLIQVDGKMMNREQYFNFRFENERNARNNTD